MYENGADGTGPVHLRQKADIVFGTEADWGEHNYIQDGVLGGFDVELTQALCAQMGKTCAIITVPWASVWPSAYNDLGWSSNPKYYPGVGYLEKWFHCSMGTTNVRERQQSIAFTNPYTSPLNTSYVASSTVTVPANGAGLRVGVFNGWFTAAYFNSIADSTATPVGYDTPDAAWAALLAGQVDAVYADEGSAGPFLASNTGYVKSHETDKGSAGVAYGCHPEFGDVVTSLNAALVAYKATSAYTALCAKYPSIQCDTLGRTFDNTKTFERQDIADHPKVRADIVFGTEADYAGWNYISAFGDASEKSGVQLSGVASLFETFSVADLDACKTLCTPAQGCASIDYNSSSAICTGYSKTSIQATTVAAPGITHFDMVASGGLGGFDVEFVKALCAHVNINCAIVTVPWQSVWAANYNTLGWTSNPKVYAGLGMQSRWFDCSTGTQNVKARQQSVAFTYPYSDASEALAGYFAPTSSNATRGSDFSQIGVIRAEGVTQYFEENMAAWGLTSSQVVFYDSLTAVTNALSAGTINAFYTEVTRANSLAATFPNYELKFAQPGWTRGVSFGCHPSKGNVVATVNGAIAGFKATNAYTTLCSEHPTVDCDQGNTVFTNAPTAADPGIAPHPTSAADIIIVTEADYGVHNGISAAYELVGFDIELTRGLCESAGLVCAITTAPWQSVWAANYNDFGWPNNPRTYAGVGHQASWFHCSMGTNNLPARQQSIAFTDMYTLSAPAGFLTAEANFPSNGANKKIGLLSSNAFTTYFEGTSSYTPGSTLYYSTSDALKAALEAGTVDAAFVDNTTAYTMFPGSSAYTLQHSTTAWSKGISYGCKPEYGDLLTRLNNALASYKATTSFTALCNRYPTVNCASTTDTFVNNKTAENPGVASHPSTRADIVITTEAGWLTHNYIQDLQLGGFDVELTALMCQKAGVSCAITTSPWQSAWPTSFPQFGLTSNPKSYPGQGFTEDWFDCQMGAVNCQSYQQSIAFTYAYSDVNSTNLGGRDVCRGVAFACHPSHGDKLVALNAAISAVKGTEEYALLCARYPNITCDCNTWNHGVPTAAFSHALLALCVVLSMVLMERL